MRIKINRETKLTKLITGKEKRKKRVGNHGRKGIDNEEDGTGAETRSPSSSRTPEKIQLKSAELREDVDGRTRTEIKMEYKINKQRNGKNIQRAA